MNDFAQHGRMSAMPLSGGRNAVKNPHHIARHKMPGMPSRGPVGDTAKDRSPVRIVSLA